MQLLWDPGMSLEQYARAPAVCYPTIRRCPVCHANVNLIGHGFYHRNALPRANLSYRLAIKRFYCRVCHRTVSLLPWFLLPRFQYSVALIIDSLRRKRRAYRELLQHWRRRFLHNTNVILALLRDLGYNASLPRAPDEKAIRLLRTIENMGPAVFSALHHKCFRRSFMAR